MVRIAGSHPADPGSSPGLGTSFSYSRLYSLYYSFSTHRALLVACCSVSHLLTHRLVYSSCCCFTCMHLQSILRKTLFYSLCLLSSSTTHDKRSFLSRSDLQSLSCVYHFVSDPIALSYTTSLASRSTSHLHLCQTRPTRVCCDHISTMHNAPTYNVVLHLRLHTTYKTNCLSTDSAVRRSACLFSALSLVVVLIHLALYCRCVLFSLCFAAQVLFRCCDALAYVSDVMVTVCVP